MSVIIRLPQGGGSDTDMVTATSEDILLDKVGVDTEGEPITGTMPNNGAVSQSLNAGGSYTIPKGYHDGTGKVTANSLASQTQATATASNILKDKTAYVSGTKITGTMVDNGAVSASINAGGSYTIPAGYHNGSGKITGNSLASQTDGTATASQILTGQTAYVDGVKVTGTMANQGTKTPSLNAGGSYTIPAGYHNGSGKITANSLASQTDATATAAQILSGQTAWVKGTKLTGSMTSRGAVTITPSTSNQTIAAGYHNGSGYVVGDSDLVAGNIKKGINIFGVAGTYEGAGTGKYLKYTETLSLTTSDTTNPDYNNRPLQLYNAKVTLPGGSSSSASFVNSATAYFAIVNVIFTKDMVSYSGTGVAGNKQTIKVGTKYFIRYQDGKMYIYANFRASKSGVVPGDASTETNISSTINTDGYGYGWNWNGRNGATCEPYLLATVSGRTTTRTATTYGTSYTPYKNEISNVSAIAQYEIYAY